MRLKWTVDRGIPEWVAGDDARLQRIQGFINAGMNDHFGKPIERKKPYSKLWCWLPRKVEHTLLMFQKQLAACFAGDIASAQIQAHDLINAAGVLGFEQLLDLALALKDTTEADDAALPALLAEGRDARDAVLDIIATTVLPHVVGPALRKAG